MKQHSVQHCCSLHIFRFLLFTGNIQIKQRELNWLLLNQLLCAKFPIWIILFVSVFTIPTFLSSCWVLVRSKKKKVCELTLPKADSKMKYEKQNDQKAKKMKFGMVNMGHQVMQTN